MANVRFFEVKPVYILVFFIMSVTSIFSQVQSSNNESWNLQPGDAIRIFTYQDSSSFLHRIFPINGKGMIFLPIYGELNVVNMSEKELLGFLESTFAPYLRTPHIQVRRYIRVSILGGFLHPGLYYVDPNNCLWQVIRLAGGTLEEEGLKKMKWEREKRVIQSDLVKFFESPMTLKEIGFKSGDQIWVFPPNRPNFFQRMLPYLSVGIQVVSLYLIAERYRR